MLERRRFPRLVLPMDVSFVGRSGAGACRLADISWGGCFLQTLAQLSIGQRTVITIPLDAGTLALSGTVLYVEPAVGFAVMFDRLTPEQIEVLSGVLGEAPADLG